MEYCTITIIQGEGQGDINERLIEVTVLELAGKEYLAHCQNDTFLTHAHT